MLWANIPQQPNRYTTIKGLTEGQLGAEVVKGTIEQIQCVGIYNYMVWLFTQQDYSRGVALLENHAPAMTGQGFTQLQT